MLKRKEFILGAAAGLAFASVATAGGVISWPGAHAQDGGVGGTRLSAVSSVPFAPPPGAPDSFADIFDKVAPAVVQIEVKTRIPTRQGGGFNIPGLPFNIIPQQPEAEGEEDDAPQATGAGSGFFISADGYIVTNNHVVADATEITVKLSDERELKATLVGRDAGTDLAVLKVEGNAFPYVDFEESAQPRVGDWVIAVGNPCGLGGTATAGIVSARGRDIGERYVDYIQIDAAINRGNSGGPTFDIYGRVIGVNTAIFSPSGGSVGIGFAIPADVVKATTSQLIEKGTVERGYLGIGVRTLTKDQFEALGMPGDFKGALVETVNDGDPGDRAGLEEGDFITAVNGVKVDSSTAVTRVVGGVRPGGAINMEVWRNGRTLDLTARSGLRPANASDDQPIEDNNAPAEPRMAQGEVVEGLTLAPLTSSLRERYGVPEDVNGLLVGAVATGSAAAKEGIRPGMIILRADNKRVSTANDFSAAVAAVKSSGRPGVLVLVWTDNLTVNVVLPVKED